MKYSAVILAFVAAVAAQSAAELAAAIPSCAKPALDEAAASVGCEVTDYACQCGAKKEELTQLARPKVLEACNTEAIAVLDATNALCEFVEANPGAGAETTAAPSQTSSSDASATTSASGVEESVSSALSSVSDKASSAVSSEAAGITSAASSAAAAATSAAAPNAAGMNAVNMGAMLGAAGVVAAMI